VDWAKNKTVIIAVIAVLALLIASPALQRILVYPQTDFFTGLYLLDSNHMTDNYPYNITKNVNYNVFLGITNHLGTSAQYQVQIKFRNAEQSAPDSISHTPRNLPSLRTVDATVANNETWELPVTFSFDYSLADANSINFNSVTFNGERLSLNGVTSTFNSNTGIFFGNLIFELWIYNNTVNSYQYHERFVDLKFSMTTTGM
jgi:hypothetical protein